jgi:hypothetical protein
LRDDYEIAYSSWEERKVAFYKMKLIKDPEYHLIAKDAWEEATKTNCYSTNFAHNIGIYYDKEKGLDLLRSRKVRGSCSHDNSPRYHLKNIAVLSADAGRWDVFLRAHLDLMNDKISRNSDNSSVQYRRETFIRELEQLPIDLRSIFVGTLLRINNAPKNQYYGSIPRISKAMAVSKDSLFYQNQLMEYISNKKLDPLNRYILARTLENQLRIMNYQEFEEEILFIQIHENLLDLPEFLRSRFNPCEDE